jgi:hypothetical protein
MHCGIVRTDCLEDDGHIAAPGVEDPDGSVIRCLYRFDEENFFDMGHGNQLALGRRCEKHPFRFIEGDPRKSKLMHVIVGLIQVLLGIGKRYVGNQKLRPFVPVKAVILNRSQCKRHRNIRTCD